jgi:hypothetical protein
LEHVRRIRVSRELRVDSLGAVGLALEEVSDPTPAVRVDEDALADVRAGADGVLGLAGGALPVEIGLERDLLDAAPAARSRSR